MISINEVLETNRMVKAQHLDVRTITMGISLLDCVADSVEETCRRIYNKVIAKAGRLVEVGEEIACGYPHSQQKSIRDSRQHNHSRNGRSGGSSQDSG